MIITCENCEAKFGLDENLIKESGSKVRCSKCQHIFTAYKPAPTPEISPKLGLEERTPEPSEKGVEEPSFLVEKEPGPAVSEEPDESLDFDLFDDEGEAGEEAFSLDDLTLDEDFSPEELDEPAGQVDAEEEILAEEKVTGDDLGFEEELGIDEFSEPTPAPTPEEEGEEEMALEDLGLDEEIPFQETLPLSEEGGEEEGVGGEEEIAFEDLMLEQEPTEESPELEEEWAPGEEEIALEDLSLEEDEAEDAFPEAELPDEERAEALGGAVVDLPEGVSGEDLEGVEVEAQGPSISPVQQPRARKRMSTPVLIALIVVLVAGAAYAGYTVLNSLDVKVPFLESLMGSKESEIVDPGNLHTSLLENLITSEFVDNRSMGRLFVIKGQVRNDYPGARNFIRVKGIIYLKDGKVVQNSMAYCGNILSKAELQTMDRLSVKKRLNNRFGDNKSNLKVSPGKALPFMIVFFDIPQDLGEFSVEVVDSAKG
ncbi:MAG: DUF3426 domain-containing protein [Thermodesulfobacteriota bacterium]|nr:DUF3426 domain-containing protein [Thermodesulfobacteriota bacterium]